MGDRGWWKKNWNCLRWGLGIACWCPVDSFDWGIVSWEGSGRGGGIGSGIWSDRGSEPPIAWRCCIKNDWLVDMLISCLCYISYLARPSSSWAGFNNRSCSSYSRSLWISIYR